MTADTTTLPRLKALAEDSRLRIVALLDARPYTVDELATVLELGASTVSHHLSKLAACGLVRRVVRGQYRLYALEREALEALGQTLLSRRELRALARVDEVVDPYDQKVLTAFLDEDGRIQAMPMKRKKFEVLLRHALRLFEDEGPWDEREVNRRLKALTHDTASLRRGFIDHGFMTRSRSGDAYTRT